MAKQKMVWKRLGFGMSKEAAEETARWARKQKTLGKPTQVKITHGKMGYSVLIKAPSFHKK